MTLDFPAWMGPRLRSFLAELHERPADQYDTATMFSGPEGSGKSTLACHILKALDPTFDVDRIAYSTSEFIEIGKRLKPGQARLLDESDEGAFSGDVHSRDSKDFAKHLFRCRELRLHNALVLPNVRWMASVVKEHRANHWFLCPQRGEAIVHRMRRADYQGAKTAWDKLFGLNFGPYDPEWWETRYRPNKVRRLLELEQPGREEPEAVASAWPPLDPAVVKAWAARLEPTLLRGA